MRRKNDAVRSKSALQIWPKLSNTALIITIYIHAPLQKIMSWHFDDVKKEINNYVILDKGTYSV